MDEKELIFMKNIRDSVPKVNQDTLLQKTFPASDIEKYLNGEYKEIGGYFAKAEDVSHIKDYAHVVESLRLDYSYVNDDRVVRPFQKTEIPMEKSYLRLNTLGVLKFLMEKEWEVQSLTNHHVHRMDLQLQETEK
ncbi:hypothetical protein [Aeribacillus pallidus]|uniref:Uncharacterized protein n=1 Tax=Aeribacillus pallidus TaxID=33936 RepID=A0A165WPX9_9BACI|nr:hypothetical protein [Aeribacillus pallidus]KZN95183.1 hypothetical protein AZI98_15420 [Aeribacillus pallidus]